MSTNINDAVLVKPETTMHNPANPSTRIEETDPVKLSARLEQARAEQLLMEAEGFQYKNEIDAEGNATARLAWDNKLADLINEQLGIIMKLRKTSAGPAPKGGKRAKKAPLDVAALEESLGLG